MPAKSGHRGQPNAAPAALAPRFRGCQEIDDYLDRRCASFETAASRPPQDEDSSSMPSITYLMLRSARPSTPLAAALRMRGRVSNHAQRCCSGSSLGPIDFLTPGFEAVRKLELTTKRALLRRSRASGNPGISVTCPLGPRLRGGRRLEEAANLITASFAGMTHYLFLSLVSRSVINPSQSRAIRSSSKNERDGFS